MVNRLPCFVMPLARPILIETMPPTKKRGVGSPSPLDFDPAEAVAALSRADRRMAGLIRRAGPFTMQPEPSQSPFDALLKSITHQQLAGKAAITIHSRVLDLLPRQRGKKPRAVLDLSDDDLRGAGLSRAKVAAVKDLAAKTLDGVVPTMAKLRKMDDETITQRLTAVRGVGVWTVQMLLIFRLGRADVLPVADYGVQKGFMLTYKTDDLPRPAELTKKAQAWRPFRSVASWYLWRAVDLDRQ